MDYLKYGFIKPEEDYSIIISVMAFICLTAVTRFEKVVKDLFGIGESKHLGNTTGNFVRAVSGVKATTSMIKKVASPAIRGIRGHKEMKSMQSDIDKAISEGRIQRNANGYLSVVDKLKPDGTDSGVASPIGGGATTAGDGEITEAAHTLTDRFKDAIDENGQLSPENAYLNNMSQMANARARLIAAQDANDTDAIDIIKKEMSGYESANKVLLKNIQASGIDVNSLNERFDKETMERMSNLARNSGFGAQQANQEAQNAASRGSQPVNVHNDINVDIKGGQGKATSTTDGNGKTSTNVKTKDNGLMYEGQDGNYYTSEERKQRDAKALVKKYNEARKARNIAVADTIFNTGSTFAGVGFAAGAWDEFHEITNAGNMISQPFVDASTAALNWNEDRRMKNKTPAKTKVTVNRDVEVEYKDNVKPIKNNNAQDYVKQEVMRNQARNNGGVITQENSYRVNQVDRYEQGSHTVVGTPPQAAQNQKRSSSASIENRREFTENRTDIYKQGKTVEKGAKITGPSDTTESVTSTHTIEQNTLYEVKGKTEVKQGPIQFTYTTSKGQQAVQVNGRMPDSVNYVNSKNLVNPREAGQIAEKFRKSFNGRLSSTNNDWSNGGSVSVDINNLGDI